MLSMYSVLLFKRCCSTQYKLKGIEDLRENEAGQGDLSPFLKLIFHFHVIQINLRNITSKTFNFQ